jgi:hypothetical protein
MNEPCKFRGSNFVGQTSHSLLVPMLARTCGLNGPQVPVLEASSAVLDVGPHGRC